jgi:hypothetical protein
MIALDENAQDYFKKVLSMLPTDHVKLVNERFDDMAETLVKGYIEESQAIEKINLSQCKGLIASLAEQVPPNIKDEIMAAVKGK